MRYAVILGTKVINAIEAEDDSQVEGHILVPHETASPGWTYHPGIKRFSPPASSVPIAVSPLQMRRALRVMGLKDQADAYLATLDEDAQEAWEYATTILRGDPFIVGAQAGLSLTDEQADDLFRLAETL